MEAKARGESMAMGIVGATLLIVGVFAPVFTVGSNDITYFEIAKEGAIAFLALGIISIMGIAINKPFWLFGTGIMAFISLHLSIIFSIMMRLRDIVGHGAYFIQWGWGIIMIGSLLLMIAGVIPLEGISKLPTSSSQPIEVLKMRLAKGEISKEEFEEKRKIME